MLALADDPFPRGTRKLSGYDDVFRVRVGRYRILYSVSDTEVIIVIQLSRYPASSPTHSLRRPIYPVEMASLRNPHGESNSESQRVADYFLNILINLCSWLFDVDRRFS